MFLLFHLFHGCKSDIFIEGSDLIPMISSIPSRNAPTTISKVHNLNVIRMAVKIAPTMIFQIEKKIPSMIKPRMAIAPKTIPTITKKLFPLIKPKRSNESLIKSMAKMIAAAMKSLQPSAMAMS